MSKEYLEETAAVQEQEGQALTEEQLDGVSGGAAQLIPWVRTNAYSICLRHGKEGPSAEICRGECARSGLPGECVIKSFDPMRHGLRNASKEKQYEGLSLWLAQQREKHRTGNY